MTRARKYWLGGTAVVLIAAVVGVRYAANRYIQSIDPKVRDYAIQYLSKRFDADVTLPTLRVQLGSGTALHAFMNKGRGLLASMEGEDLVLRRKGRPDEPPMLSIKQFRCEFDVGMLLESPMSVPHIFLDGMEIQVPPKGDRPSLAGNSDSANTEFASDSNSKKTVIFGLIDVTNTKLVLNPRQDNPKKVKKPLEFEIATLQLKNAGVGQSMDYTATLTNPRPKGEIVSKGKFGPWVTDDPGSSPLSGDYVFRNADLGVFNAIAGILQSTGTFTGQLQSVQAKGEATVPDFRLKSAGNPVPLKTTFEVEVDGTNGNTTLKPVHAVLGTTKFTTNGAVIKHEDGNPRAIDLKVNMPAGNLKDLLRVAMKGDPFMDGVIKLNTMISVPPFSGKVREKLILNGTFEVSQGLFLKSNIQYQIDHLSRRAQGQPNNEEIDDVFGNFHGKFHMDDEAINFQQLAFSVPGADVALSGGYDLGADNLDFHGSLSLDAKVSQTLTGWKRWVAKPIDPLFSRNGAGTFLGIGVTGSAKKPHFSASRNPKDPSKDKDKEDSKQGSDKPSARSDVKDKAVQTVKASR